MTASVRQTVWALATLAAIGLALRSPDVWHEHDAGDGPHSHGALDHEGESAGAANADAVTDGTTPSPRGQSSASGHRHSHGDAHEHSHTHGVRRHSHRGHAHDHAHAHDAAEVKASASSATHASRASREVSHGHIHFAVFGIQVTLPWPEPEVGRESRLDRQLVAKYRAARRAVGFTDSQSEGIPAFVPDCAAFGGRNVGLDWLPGAGGLIVSGPGLCLRSVPEPLEFVGCDRDRPLAPPPRSAARG